MFSTPQSIRSNAAIRIAIADDHAIFRQGICFLLKDESTIQLIGQAANGRELIRLVEQEKPDVVITDIMMPEMDGVETTRLITAQFPQVGVIALSMFDNESLVLDMLEAGAKGFLLKTTTKEEIIEAVTIVKGKGTYYCATTSNKLVRLMARSNFNPYKPGKKPQFTDRELEIIRLLCQELCSKEIALHLGLNPRSVESARERIQEKIGAKNMIGIAVYAIRNNIYCLD